MACDFVRLAQPLLKTQLGRNPTPTCRELGDLGGCLALVWRSPMRRRRGYSGVT